MERERKEEDKVGEGNRDRREKGTFKGRAAGVGGRGQVWGICIRKANRWGGTEGAGRW